LVGLFAVAVVLAVLVPPIIDWSAARASLERRFSVMIGGPVRIAGPIGVRLLPQPSLDLRQIVIERRSEGVQVEAKRLLIAARLLPLLIGDVEIDSSVLERPIVTLTKVADTAQPS